MDCMLKTICMEISTFLFFQTLLLMNVSKKKNTPSTARALYRQVKMRLIVFDSSNITLLG